MGNSFPGLCSFKLEQSVECLNLENVVSFHFPYLTLISVPLLTEVSFRYQAEGRTEAAPPSAVTRHGAMQWTDKYGRLHYCLWCPLTRVCLSLNFVQFSHFVSGLGWLGWAVWAGLGWAGQHKSPYVIFTKVATSARLPTSVLPLTREKISLIKDSSPSRQTHIHTSLLTTPIPGELGLLYREVRLLRHRHSGARLHLRPDALLAAAVLHLQSRH